MSGTREFFDLVSKDKDVKIELGTETVNALTALLVEKGFKDDAMKAIDAVTAKVAEAHGFDLNAMEELSPDELNAVAGGAWGCRECLDALMTGETCKGLYKL